MSGATAIGAMGAARASRGGRGEAAPGCDRERLTRAVPYALVRSGRERPRRARWAARTAARLLERWRVMLRAAAVVGRWRVIVRAPAVVGRWSGMLRAAATAVRSTVALGSAGTALALLAACASSPPVRFYTLSDTAPEATPPGGVGAITISGVTIPGEIDRPEVVRRSSANQLNISELDRWAAPLDETIRRVLTDDIARRVPTPAPGPQHSVSVDIHEFYGDGSCDVTLRVVWTLKESGVQSATGQAAHGGQAAGPVRSGSEDIRVPSSGSCPVTLPETMSIALGRLSDRIIAAVAAPAPQK